MPGMEIVMVHGSWHGAWCWDQLRAELTALGRGTHAVDLPSTSGPEFGVADDADVIRETVDGIDGPVVLLGHSYGGIPVSQAAEGAASIQRLIYLAAFQLDLGSSLVDAAGMQLPAELDSLPIPDDPHKVLFADVPTALADEAVAKLRPQSAQSFRDKQTAAAWHSVPSTYILCEQDQALPPEIQQQMAERATEVRRLDTSHSPFLSTPAELAVLLHEITR